MSIQEHIEALKVQLQFEEKVQKALNLDDFDINPLIIYYKKYSSGKAGAVLIKSNDPEKVNRFIKTLNLTGSKISTKPNFQGKAVLVYKKATVFCKTSLMEPELSLELECIVDDISLDVTIKIPTVINKAFVTSYSERRHAGILTVSNTPASFDFEKYSVKTSQNFQGGYTYYLIGGRVEPLITDLLTEL